MKKSWAKMVFISAFSFITLFLISVSTPAAETGWINNPQMALESLNRVCISNNLLVGVGGEGVIKTSSDGVNWTGIQGQDHYLTSNAIAEKNNTDNVNYVVLVSGNNFADALYASALGHNLGAPILLVNSTADASTSVFDYIKEHLSPGGHIYLVGGTGIIGNDFVEELNHLGYASEQITQISGTDRYETSVLAAQMMNTQPKMVLITTGEDYKEALVMESFAANFNIPLLLTKKDTLPPSVKTYLISKNIDSVLIVGNSNSINGSSLKAEIKTLLPDAEVTGLFSDNFTITEWYFLNLSKCLVPNPSQLYIAASNEFADSLSGSVLASKDGSPIIFLNPNEPIPVLVEDYLKSIPATPLVALGGPGAVPDELIQEIQKIWLTPYSITVPENLLCEARSDGIIDLKWSKIEEVDYYLVYYSSVPDAGFDIYYMEKCDNCERVPDNTVSFKNLRPGTEYYFKIKAVKDGKQSDYSKTVSTVAQSDYTKTVSTAVTYQFIRRVNTSDKIVALTFDDEGNSSSLSRIILILAENEAVGTFFISGAGMKNHPDLIKSILANGNAVGNHSYSHSMFTKLSASQMKDDLNSLDELVQNYTGHSTKPLFRAPYGDHNTTVMQSVGDAGYIIVGWNVDPRDWSGISADKITQSVLNNVSPGSIVLLHANYGALNTPDALPGIIRGLKERGYKIVTIPELFNGILPFTNQPIIKKEQNPEIKAKQGDSIWDISTIKEGISY